MILRQYLPILNTIKRKRSLPVFPWGNSGGVEIKTELSYRKVEVDGAYIMDVVGLNVLESATATMKANLIELTAENLRRSLNATMTDATTDEAPAGYKIIKPKRYLEEGTISLTWPLWVFIMERNSLSSLR
ncbi:hypothetical protein KEH51_29150 [[Brevibacterium] frigoritolerans]|uniref:Uncharacterized protein n=1 Tax=Peribacillus frigoritolerans TaxID=450367 RepID=A0A941FLK0_9BACI|nr:hypothetical protein [Peribacillus frigoritolerans]